MTHYLSSPQQYHSFHHHSSHHHLPPKNLTEYLQRLQASSQIVHIRCPVSPYLEIAEITRRIVAQKGPALLFTHVEGSAFPVVTNLYGTQDRLNIAFGKGVEERIGSYVDFLTKDFPPSFSALWKKRYDLFRLLSVRVRRTQSIFSAPPPIAFTWKKPLSLHDLPCLTSWKEDGGPFITLPLVYTESPHCRKMHNVGMYRIQRFDEKTTGLHWQIGKGGGFHFHEAEKLDQDLPVSIFIGGAPALTLAAITPLPENVPEYIFASFLMGRPLDVTYQPKYPHPIPIESDFALLGYAKNKERRMEGPFGDHFGYISLAHEFPVFHCKHLLARRNAIFPATVVGPPPQEDMIIGEFLQKIMRPLFPVVMPSIKRLHTYSESGFHALATACIEERYEKEALSSALRILGEGQLALTKILFIIDDLSLSLDNFPHVFSYLLARIRPQEDIIILSHTANDTLDYTGTSLNKGSKAVFIGVGKNAQRRILPTTFQHSSDELSSSYILSAIVYCPGCLVVACCRADISLHDLTHHPIFKDWPCVIVVDEPHYCVASQMQFLWNVFTRFEPAQDIYFKHQTIRRNSLAFSFPMIIDARMKPQYPPVLQVDEKTHDLVSRRWNEYFST